MPHRMRLRFRRRANCNSLLPLQCSRYTIAHTHVNVHVCLHASTHGYERRWTTCAQFAFTLLTSPLLWCFSTLFMVLIVLRRELCHCDIADIFINVRFMLSALFTAHKNKKRLSSGNCFNTNCTSDRTKPGVLKLLYGTCQPRL